MADTIKKLTIEGFKSIRKLDNFPLRALNVLIGANGAGKSNFIGFFRLLHEMIDERLQVALATVEGGADACLYLGPKITREFAATLTFGNNAYEFALVPTPDNRLIFSKENTVFYGDFATKRTSLGSGHPEAMLKERQADPGRLGTGAAFPHMFSARFQAGSSTTSMTLVFRHRFAARMRLTITRSSGRTQRILHPSCISFSGPTLRVIFEFVMLFASPLHFSTIFTCVPRPLRPS